MMKRNHIIFYSLFILLSSCSLFEDKDDLDIKNDLYLRTVFQGTIYGKEGDLILNAQVQIDLFSEKDGEAKSRSVTYTDDFGGFTSVFKLGTTRQLWYYRIYVMPPREMEFVLASEGPVELGSLKDVEIKLGE